MSTIEDFAADIRTAPVRGGDDVDLSLPLAQHLHDHGYRKLRTTGSTDELWNDGCPCGHGWDQHNKTVGCFAGWEYTGPDPGVASKEGCMCQLAHSERSTDDLV